MEANQIYSAHRPRKGQTVTYNGKIAGKVLSIEGNLCWVDYASGPNPFIWAFKDGVNAFHDWPGRSGARMAQHGDISTIGLIAP